MVTTRAASRLATPRGETSDTSSCAPQDDHQDDRGTEARAAQETRQRRRSAQAGSAEEHALLKELGISPRPPESSAQTVARKASETLELLMIRAGATLLTPWERFLYALSVLALTVLVCVGVSKAVQFYANSLQQVMQR